MNNIIVDHKNVVKKIPLNDKNVDEMLKTFNINYNTVSIDGHIMYKFYFQEGILIAPKTAFVFLNVNTKEFTVGYTYSIVNE